MATLEIIFKGISAVATLVGACGIFSAVYQLRFHAWIKAQEIFTDPHFVDARRKVFNKQDAGNGPWEESDYFVCRKMDEIARLEPFLPNRKILTTWSDPIGKSWVKLRNLVKEERDNIGWQKKMGQV